MFIKNNIKPVPLSVEENLNQVYLCIICKRIKVYDRFHSSIYIENE